MADKSLAAVVAEIKANPAECYVYVLSRPDGTPFYVGCAKRRRRSTVVRIREHEIEARRAGKCLRHRVIRKLWRAGSEPAYAIDSWHDDEDAVLRREAELIAIIGRRDLGTGPLVNMTDGGTGSLNPSPETRAKIRASRLKPENRSRSSEMMTRRNADPVFKAASSDRMRDLAVTDERFKDVRRENGRRGASRMSAFMKAIHQDPAFIERRNALIAEVNANPELRAKANEAVRRSNALPDNRRRLVDRNLALAADPTFCAGREERLRRHNEYRRELKARCRAMKAARGGQLVEPIGRASNAEWERFEGELMGAVR